MISFDTIPTYVIMGLFLCVIGPLQNKKNSMVDGDIIR